MAIVVRLGPVALLQRRAGRIEELERMIGEPVELIEVASVVELVRVVSASAPFAVVLDAAAPGDLEESVAAAGSRPVLRPLWRRVRNSRGEVDKLFDGYGLLTTAGAVEPLTDGQLRRHRSALARIEASSMPARVLAPGAQNVPTLDRFRG